MKLGTSHYSAEEGTRERKNKQLNINLAKYGGFLSTSQKSNVTRENLRGAPHVEPTCEGSSPECYINMSSVCQGFLLQPLLPASKAQPPHSIHPPGGENGK